MSLSIKVPVCYTVAYHHKKKCWVQWRFRRSSFRPHQMSCSDVSPPFIITKYNHHCKNAPQKLSHFWNAVERCGNTISPFLVYEYSTKQWKMTLVNHFSVGYLRSDGEVFKIMVQELKCGSVLWVCIPTLQHQPIDGIWYMMWHRFGHAVSLPYLVNNFSSMHACQHWQHP